jgi:methylphosphotriester-DNA--protein-cysteine methyltransferase
MTGYSTPKSRWTALLNRDALAATAFVYCVTTTKIYCRPNCPSRLARRANVEFHNTAADARAAGYRACMRCRPEVADDEVDPQKIAIAKTCASIDREAEGGQKKGLKALAKDVGFTESHFCRVFKKGTGMTVGEYRASVSGKRNPTGDIAESGAQSKSLGEVQNPGVLNAPYEFDFNSLPLLDTQDQAQLDFELTSGWYDFSNPPDIYPYFGTVTEIPYEELLDNGHSNPNTESSLDSTPNLWPLVTKMDDDPQVLNLDQQFTYVI